MNTNTQTAHTPGPWSTSRERPSPLVITIRNTPASSVAEVFGQSLAEAEANARLIAAAPELLAALQDTDAHFVAHFGASWASSEIAKSIRSAIAKATEGQK